MDSKYVDALIDRYKEDGYIDITESGAGDTEDQVEFQTIITALEYLSESLFDDEMSKYVRLG